MCVLCYCSATRTIDPLGSIKLLVSDSIIKSLKIISNKMPINVNTSYSNGQRFGKLVYLLIELDKQIDATLVSVLYHS